MRRSTTALLTAAMAASTGVAGVVLAAPAGATTEIVDWVRAHVGTPADA